MVGIILTRPQGGGIPGTAITGIIIPASPPSAPGSNIVVVDTCACMMNSSIKWIYTILSPARDKVVTGEVLALSKLGAPTHNHYAIIGDIVNLPYKLDVISIGGVSIGLEITNLSGNFPNPVDRINYTINIVRIQVIG